MWVLTLDQRGSTDSPDLVSTWSNRLNSEFSTGLRLPFTRAAGDEMQALAMRAETVVDIVLEATRPESWWVGVGLGGVEHVGDTARDSRGEAFRAARAAVNEAKRRAWACAVRGEPEAGATRVESCLALLVFLRATRSARGWQLVDMAARGMRATEIATELGITKQAVSKQLRAAGFAEEQRGRALAVEALQGSWTPES